MKTNLSKLKKVRKEELPLTCAILKFNAQYIHSVREKVLYTLPCSSYSLKGLTYRFGKIVEPLNYRRIVQPFRNTVQGVLARKSLPMMMSSPKPPSDCMSLVQKVPQALSSLPVAADTVLSLVSSTPSKLFFARYER